MICFGLGCQQLDDALLVQQRAAYAVQGVDESEPVQAGKKRKKQVYVNGEDVSHTELLCYNSRCLMTNTSSSSPRKPVVASKPKNPNPPLNPENERTQLSMLHPSHLTLRLKRFILHFHAAASLQKKLIVASLASSSTPMRMESSKGTRLYYSSGLRVWI